MMNTLLPLLSAPARGFERGPRRLRVLSGPLLLLIALVLTAILFSPLRQTLLTQYAYKRIWLHSLNQPWRSLPRDVSLYQGTKDCAGTSFDDEGRSLESLDCPTLPYPALGTHEVLATNPRSCMTRARMRSSPEYGTTRGSHTRHRYQTTSAARSAIVLRAWEGFEWTSADVQNLRKMQADLSDLIDADNRPAFDVVILMHIHNASLFDTNTPEQIIQTLVPFEFASMTHLWTYNDTKAAYPLVGEYDVYYHMFMALQLFSQQHAQYETLWNWEMDVRYTGHHGFFHNIGQWADRQSDNDTWHRNQRFHVPCLQRPADDVTGLDRCHDMRDEFPEATYAASTDIRSHEGADLITLLPLFDVHGTMWPYRDQIYNYDPRSSWLSPRLASVGTNLRLSKRLLYTMHEENRAGRSMMSEMWPTTVAHHAGLKTVYAPNPSYFDQQWSTEQLEKTFNAGAEGRVGGSLKTVINQEENFRGSTWYWTTEFSIELYRRWAGLASDGPGSPRWEEEHGMMCLPAMLLHPIKTSKLHPAVVVDGG